MECRRVSVYVLRRYHPVFHDNTGTTHSIAKHKHTHFTMRNSMHNGRQDPAVGFTDWGKTAHRCQSEVRSIQ